MLSCISKIIAQKRVRDPKLKSLQISIVGFSGRLSGAEKNKQSKISFFMLLLQQ